MKLSEFKAGDVIHRTEPVEMQYTSLSPWDCSSGTKKDYSYIQSAMEVVDIKSGLLFYRDRITFLGRLKDDATVETIPVSRFDDDHWDFYPLEHLPAPTLPPARQTETVTKTS